MLPLVAASAPPDVAGGMRPKLENGFAAAGGGRPSRAHRVRHGGRPVSSILPTYGPRPLTFVSGRGARLVADDGAEYLDCVGGIATVALGHCHPAPIAAFARQAALLGHVSNLYGSGPPVALADRLLRAGGIPRRRRLLLQLGRGGERGGDQARAPARARGRPPTRRRSWRSSGPSTDGRSARSRPTWARAKKDPFEPLPAGFRHVPPRRRRGARGGGVAGDRGDPGRADPGRRRRLAARRRATWRSPGSWRIATARCSSSTRCRRASVARGAWFRVPGPRRHAPTRSASPRASARGLPIGRARHPPPVGRLRAGRPRHDVRRLATDRGGRPRRPRRRSSARASSRSVARRRLVARRAPRRSAGRRRRPRGRAAPRSRAPGRGRGRRGRGAPDRHRVLVNAVTPTALRLCPPLVFSRADAGELVEALAAVLPVATPST